RGGPSFLEGSISLLRHWFPLVFLIGSFIPEGEVTSSCTAHSPYSPLPLEGVAHSTSPSPSGGEGDHYSLAPLLRGPFVPKEAVPSPISPESVAYHLAIPRLYSYPRHKSRLARSQPLRASTSSFRAFLPGPPPRSTRSRPAGTSRRGSREGRRGGSGNRAQCAEQAGGGGSGAMAGCCAVLYAFLFEYDTPRIVLIRSRKVGLMNRMVQLLILAYVIGWVFVWEKGYQETDSVVSSVTTKAKGVTMTNTSKLGFRIWDVADYVIPAQEENSLFIMTNLIITMNQTQGLCPEIPDKTTTCKSDANCAAGSSGTHSNGLLF
uniref:Purinergic receptor P2X 4 n=2 Tax=Sus scrofa TaxID=9823 RepID=A0A8D1CSS2_PIG